MAKHQQPSPPTDVKINGQGITTEFASQAMNHVRISARIDDPTQGQQVRLLIQFSSNDFKTHRSVRSDFGRQDRIEHLTLPDLKRSTLYKCRLWTIGKPDQVSKQYTSASFWTNRNPSAVLVTPVENSEYDESQTILFDWKFVDPDIQNADDNDNDQTAYQLSYRADGGSWKTIPAGGGFVGRAEGKNTYRQVPATYFVTNTNYSWTVKVRDTQGVWSDAPLSVSFYVRGTSSPPTLLSPKGGIGTAVIADGTVEFSWKFRDPDPKNRQTQADIRWRAVGTEDVGGVGDTGWTTLFGEGITPGLATQWDIPGNYFTPGVHYEWQVRTYDDKASGIPSGWSLSAEFVAAVRPGSAITDLPLAEEVEPLQALGCGQHRAFIYDRGGRVLRGEIKPLARVLWNRKRDDIGNAIIDTNGFDQDCCVLLGNLQSWVHELVIFRDGVRVFEGPITRITYTSVNVEIEAKDVMAYLYRRVMRQGYNDAYRRIDLTPKTAPSPAPSTKGGPYTIVGTNTVVERALQITLNALAYQDPNVLAYVTAITNPNDALEQRIVPDYSRSAWEEIDDLAATAGLDYVTVGRRIVYWDTNRAIGRLPEMRDGDFSDPVIVTEYGMGLANWYAVTNNSGVAGIAYPLGHTASNWFERYGPVEMTSSAYSEQEASKASTENLTTAERDALVKSLTKQATNGVAHRYPVPVNVRVPDNSALNPQVNLGINQLIPGVWIPLRATLTCRKLAQWQKLDSVDVEEVAGTEAVRVTMSPAPHDGDDDPDLNVVAETD
jgi:hypothetical protein